MTDQRPSVVYIGGTGRSGSTLLARLLSSVPGVVAVGELRYVLDRGLTQDHLCGCGRPFRSCPFWQDVFRRALPDSQGDAAGALMALSKGVDRNRYIPQHVWPRLRTRAFRARLDEYGGYLTRLYTAISDVSGASVIIDSSKDPSYAFVLHATGGVDLGIVHLLRDSRAVAFSWTRPKRRPEVHSHVAHMATRSPLRSGVLWTAYHVLFEWLERHTRGFVACATRISSPTPKDRFATSSNGSARPPMVRPRPSCTTSPVILCASRPLRSSSAPMTNGATRSRRRAFA